MNYLHCLNIILWQYYDDFAKLIKFFPDLEYLWKKACKQELISAGISEKSCELFLKKRGKINPDSEEKTLEKKQIHCLMISDPVYPTLLKTIYDPPLILYLKGTLPQDWSKSISIVGTRRPSPYGNIQADAFTTFLAQAGLTIVSGLAMGIDSIAHRAAVKLKKPTVAILGTGVLEPYPRSNARLAQNILDTGGALISEYPPTTPAYPGNFPRRNRIISGLTPGTLVVEGQKHSGSLITARTALEEAREVFAIPADITRPQSEAPNHLISESKAHPVTSPEMVLEILGFETQPQLSAHQDDLSGDEQLMLDRLRETPMNIDQLIENMKSSINHVQGLLSMLELKGYIQKERDAFYVRI